MTDVPFVISARFRKVVQTAPHESEEAEVSAQTKVDEGVDAAPAIEGTMSLVKRQVYIALGKEQGVLTAQSTEPAKRGPGRPPKTEPVKETKTEQTQVKPGAPAKETPKPDDDFDFGDPSPEKVEAIDDKKLQDECGKAAKAPGMEATLVKNLFQVKYGAQRVSLLKPEERAAFLADLANLVSEKAPK